MRNILFISLILFISAACQKDNPGKDVIPTETLVPILMDLHMVSAIQSESSYRDLSMKFDSVDTYSYIFNKHNVTKAEFDSTISWYSSHPQLFTGIYDEVIMQLNRMMDTLDPDREY